MVASNDPKDDTYSEEETKRRAAATMRVLLATPPKPHKDSKLGVKRESKPKA